MAKETKKGIMEMLNGENLNVEDALKNANAMDQEVLEMAQNKMKEEEKKQRSVTRSSLLC